MRDWKKAKFFEKCVITPGYAFDSSDFTELGIPIIKIANIKIGQVDLEDSSTQYVDSSFLSSINSKYRIQRGDILVSLTGSHLTQPNSVVGRVGRYRYDQTALLNQRAAKIDAKPKESNKDFVYYILSTNSLRTEIAMLAHGAANQANVSHKDIEKIKLFWPPLPIQRKIAAILTAYDDLIENNNRRIAILEKMAEELYREWFVRLRFPGHEGAKIVKGVPEGWEVRKIRDSFDFLEGPGIRNWQYTDKGVPFINIRLINDGQIDTSTASYISESEAYGKYAHFLLKEKDYVLSTSGSIGRGAVVQSENLPLCLNTSVIRFRPKGDEPREFMYALLRSRSFLQNVEMLANGAAQQNFGPTHLNIMNYISPPIALKVAYQRFVEPIISQAMLHRKTVRGLRDTRDRLLSRLMSGKIDVEKLDIQFPKSMEETGASTGSATEEWLPKERTKSLHR